MTAETPANVPLGFHELYAQMGRSFTAVTDRGLRHDCPSQMRMDCCFPVYDKEGALLTDINNQYPI